MSSYHYNDYDCEYDDMPLSQLYEMDSRLIDIHEQITHLFNTGPFCALYDQYYDTEPLHIDDYLRLRSPNDIDFERCKSYFIKQKQSFDNEVAFFLDEAVEKMIAHELKLEDLDMNYLFHFINDHINSQHCLLSWSCFVMDIPNQYHIRPLSVWLFHYCHYCLKNRLQ